MTCKIQVMSWMEQCAYISASRLRGSHLLTVMHVTVMTCYNAGMSWMKQCAPTCSRIVCRTIMSNTQPITLHTQSR
jgi:acyl-CoA hydrolase